MVLRGGGLLALLLWAGVTMGFNTGKVTMPRQLGLQRPRALHMSIADPLVSPAPETRRERAEVAKSELRAALAVLGDPSVPESEARGAVEEAVGVLQAFHIPAMTVDFLRLMLDGGWRLIYSTVKPQPGLPRNEAGAPLVRVYEVRQTIVFGEDGEHGQKEGSLVNTMDWDVPSEEGVRGYLNVECNYEVSSNGALEVEPNKHVIKPQKMPDDPQECVTGLQSMCPEIFDPKGRWITTYADPELRMLAGFDERLQGVVNIFEKIKPEES